MFRSVDDSCVLELRCAGPRDLWRQHPELPLTNCKVLAKRQHRFLCFYVRIGRFHSPDIAFDHVVLDLFIHVWRL
jgi:hypothetical protein